MICSCVLAERKQKRITDKHWTCSSSNNTYLGFVSILGRLSVDQNLFFFKKIEMCSECKK
jgi:hypothetical protein